MALLVQYILKSDFILVITIVQSAKQGKVSLIPVNKRNLRMHACSQASLEDFEIHSLCLSQMGIETSKTTFTKTSC